MNIQKMQPITFNAKYRYIPQDMSENMYTLIKKMRAETKITKRGDFWDSTSVKGVQVLEEGKIKDGKFLAKRNEANELVPYGKDFSMIEMDKSQLVINNRTGKVVQHKKPFYMSWNSLFRKASWLVIEALNSYNNQNRVKKIIIKKEGLTKQGQQKAKEELKPVIDLIDRMVNQWKK